MSGTDGQLVVAYLGGDRGAFDAIYDRYADRIFTFCASVLRDQHDATDATQDTFVRATTKLDQLRDPERLRPWLFAIARNETMNRLRRRARERPEEDFEDLVADEVDPGAGLVAADTASLVWDAAGSLQPRDRELLELHIRNGLEGADLAEAMGVTAAHASTMVNRLKERLGNAVGSMLVARSGRAACPRLDAALVGWDGSFSLDVRSKVTRHVRGCDVCTATQSDLVSPAKLAAVLPLLPAPLALREAVLSTVGSGAVAAAGTVAPGVVGGAGGVASSAGATATAGSVAGVGGTALVVKVAAAVVVGALLVGGAVGVARVVGDRPQEATAASPSSVTTQAPPPPTTAAVVVEPPVSSAPSSTSTTTTSTAVATTVPTTVAAVPTSVAVARDAWASRAGQPYSLTMRINSEGLAGIYCVSGIAGQVGSEVDTGQVADDGVCATEAQNFVGEPVGVDLLLQWAEEAEAGGGSAQYDVTGVPLVVDISGLGDYSLYVEVMALTVDGEP